MSTNTDAVFLEGLSWKRLKGGSSFTVGLFCLINDEFSHPIYLQSGFSLHTIFHTKASKAVFLPLLHQYYNPICSVHTYSCLIQIKPLPSPGMLGNFCPDSGSVGELKSYLLMPEGAGVVDGWGGGGVQTSMIREL